MSWSSISQARQGSCVDWCKVTWLDWCGYRQICLADLSGTVAALHCQLQVSNHSKNIKFGKNGRPTSNMSRPSPRRASTTTVIGNSLPNAARETSSATATVATGAAAQCVLHHRKQRHASAHPKLFLDSVASLQQNVGAYSRVLEWPRLQLDDLQIVPGATLLSSSTNS